MFEIDYKTIETIVKSMKISIDHIELDFDSQQIDHDDLKDAFDTYKEIHKLHGRFQLLLEKHRPVSTRID